MGLNAFNLWSYGGTRCRGLGVRRQMRSPAVPTEVSSQHSHLQFSQWKDSTFSGFSVAQRGPDWGTEEKASTSSLLFIAEQFRELHTELNNILTLSTAHQLEVDLIILPIRDGDTEA